MRLGSLCKFLFEDANSVQLLLAPGGIGLVGEKRTSFCGTGHVKFCAGGVLLDVVWREKLLPSTTVVSSRR